MTEETRLRKIISKITKNFIIKPSILFYDYLRILPTKRNTKKENSFNHFKTKEIEELKKAFPSDQGLIDSHCCHIHIKNNDTVGELIAKKTGKKARRWRGWGWKKREKKS